jgi:hypothetical protein
MRPRQVSSSASSVQKFYVDNKIVETAVPVADTFTNEFVN